MTRCFDNTVSCDRETHAYNALHYAKKRSYFDDVQKRLCSVDAQRPKQAGIGNISRNSAPRHYKRTGSHSATRLFIGLMIMGSLPGINPSELSRTICKYFHYKDRCESDLRESLNKTNITEGSHCLGSFTHNICWPHTPAGTAIEVPCPDFFGEANETLSGIKYCSGNGTWFSYPDPITGEDTEWATIDDCIQSENISESDQNSDLLENLRIMYTVGYTVSLICLVLALMLLSFFKKLHCTRNYIHMNLMVSFILRYTVILVKDSVLDSHYNIEIAAGPEFDIDALRQYCDDDDTTGWVLTRCRLVITLMHYAVTANYFWLLAEGLYLQMLLVFVMSENKYFAGFMVFGWGAPWISVLVWVVLRMNFENKGCWDMNMDMNIWWTIRAPIMISILVNFCMYINIVRMIVSKLRANNMARTDRKLRLAKSTLALIPLLGIHYIVFMFLLDEMATSSDPGLHLKLAFELFFSSIQGAMIAILYCFLNNEVRAEVSRAWNQWRNHQRLPRGGSTFRKSSTIGSTNNSTQVTIMYSRNSGTASDMPLLGDSARRQSHKSTDSETDSKEDSVCHSKANGNYVPVNMIGNRDKANGLLTSVIPEIRQQNGKEVGNGDLELSLTRDMLLRET